MGVSVCVQDPLHSPSITYDIQTSTQGVLFLCYALIYILLEVILLATTVRLFYTNTSLLTNFSPFIFYCTFNLTLICSMLYFLGGIVCFGITFYNVICNLPFLFQGITVFVLIAQIENSYSLLDGLNAVTCSAWVLVLGLSYIVTFIGLLWHDLIIDQELCYFHMFNAVCHAVLASVLSQKSTNLYKIISQRYPTLLDALRRRAWKGIMITFSTLLFSRAAMALLNFFGFTTFLKETHHGAFTLYKLVFSMLFELFPCTAFTLFIRLQIYHMGNKKPFEGTKGYAKKCWPTPTCSFTSLAEEMVDNEGIDQDD